MITPKEKASKLVWWYYNTTEHMLSDEYQKYDWNIAVSCALKVVDELFELMQNDDELHEDCHFANSIWVNYLTELKKEIENFRK